MNSNNQDSLSCYDAAGNKVGVPSCTPNLPTTYFYDAENRICSFGGTGNCTTGTIYTYDGDGNRVEKSNGTLYWYGPHGEVLAETSTGGSDLNEYIFFGGKRIARVNSSGSVYYYFADQLGTSRVIVQDGSTPTLCYDSDFYSYGGERTPYTNTCSQNYKLTGKERDSESGLDNFGARYYSSLYGRFATPDWSENPDPVPYSDMSDPQSLNLYTYVRNSPLRRRDIDGHHQVCDPDSYSKGPHGELIVTGGACHEVADPVQMHQQSAWQTIMAITHTGFLGVVKTYQTYTKQNSQTGKTYSGRTRGTRTPDKNVAARDRNHQMNEEGYGTAQLDKSSTNPDAIRGREQQLIDANGGAQSQGGTSGNAINGVSSTNPNAQTYSDAANSEFGPMDGLMGPEGMVEPTAIEDIPIDFIF